MKEGEKRSPAPEGQNPSRACAVAAVDSEHPQAGREKKRVGSVRLASLSASVDRAISGFFRWQGRFVARHAGVVIVASIVLSVGLAVTWFHIQRKESNDMLLYTKPAAQSNTDRDYVIPRYGFPKLQERILVVAREDFSQNLLENNVAKTNIHQLFKLWHDIESISVYHNYETSTTERFCIRPRSGGPCVVASVLDAWSYNDTTFTMDDNIHSTISTGINDLFALPLAIDYVLGGVERNSSGDITTAHAFQIVFDLDQNGVNLESPREIQKILEQKHNGEANGDFNMSELEDKIKRKFIYGRYVDKRAFHWDANLSKMLKQYNSNNSYPFKAYTTNILEVERESKQTASKDMIWIIFGFALVLVYSHFVLFRNNWAICKAHLVWISLISIGMAIFSSYAVAQLAQKDSNRVINGVPFLLLGLGMDDTFIIIGAYRKTGLYKPAEDRIAEAMGKAGTSIFVTSMTDFFTFMLGTFTQLPAMQSFAVYASVGVLFDFLYQVTFFVAVLALEARREAHILHDLPQTTSDSDPGLEKSKNKKLENFWDASVTSEERTDFSDDSAKIVSVIANIKVADQNVTKTEPGPSLRRIFGTKKFDPERVTTIARFFGEWLPQIIMRPTGKLVVFAVELFLLGFAIYGLMKTKTDFQYKEWFTPRDSWLREGFEVERKYFESKYIPFSVYTKDPENGKTYFDHQDELEAIATDIQNSEFVGNLTPLRSWYQEYLAWVATSKYKNDLVDMRAPNSTAFVAWLHEFLDTTQQGGYFFEHVKFSPDGRRIISSKIDAVSTEIVDGSHAIRMVDSLRKVALRAAPSLDPIVYDPVFSVYDSLRIIKRETLFNVMLATTGVFLVTLVTLANFLIAVAVVAMVALTDIILFGYMWYTNLTFNVVTSMNVVIAIGISVDYSAHIAKSFLIQEGIKTERAQKALKCVGEDVFYGGFTTFLAVVAMAPAQHFIFRVFLKMISAIVILGLWHGIIVLPVVLSLIGGTLYSRTAENKLVGNERDGSIVRDKTKISQRV